MKRWWLPEVGLGRRWPDRGPGSSQSGDATQETYTSPTAGLKGDLCSYRDECSAKIPWRGEETKSGEPDTSYPSKGRTPKAEVSKSTCPVFTGEQSETYNEESTSYRNNFVVKRQSRRSSQTGQLRGEAKVSVQDPTSAEGVWNEAKEAVRQEVWGPAGGDSREVGQRKSKGRRKRKKQKERKISSQRKRQARSPERKRTRKRKRQGEKKEQGLVWEGQAWQDWRKGLRAGDGIPLHLLGHFRRIIRGMVSSQSALGASLRGLLHSPMSGKRKPRPGSGLFPLLMPERWRNALRHFAYEKGWSKSQAVRSMGMGSRNRQSWQQLGEAWSGLFVIGLNTSLGLCTETGLARSPLEKEVLVRLGRDAVSFV